MSTAARARAGRDRAQENKLKAARERRLQLNSEQLSREKRIDEATVDIEFAWEARAKAEQAVGAAEAAAAAARTCRPRR